MAINPEICMMIDFVCLQKHSLSLYLEFSRNAECSSHPPVVTAESIWNMQVIQSGNRVREHLLFYKCGNDGTRNGSVIPGM